MHYLRENQVFTLINARLEGHECRSYEQKMVSGIKDLIQPKMLALTIRLMMI